MLGKTRRNSRKGYTLSVLIIIIAVVVILGMALLWISTNEFSASIREQNRIKSYYIARAGAEVMAEWIGQSGSTAPSLSDIKDVIEDNQYNPDNPFSGAPATPYVDGVYYVNLGGNQYEPVVYSHGVFREGDRLAGERTVILQMQKRGLSDSAVMVTSDLYIQSAGTFINGEITLINSGEVTNLPTGWTGPTEFKREYFDYSGVSLPGELDLVDLDDYEPTEPIDPADPIDPDAPEPYHDGEYGTFDYVFDTSQRPNMVYLGNETFNNQDVLVTGGGTMTFYANNLTMKGSLITDSGTRTVVKIIDGGSLTFQTPDSGIGTEFQATVYAPYADVEVRANITGLGSIFGESIRFQSGGGITFDPAFGGDYPELIGLDSFGYRILTWRTQ